MRKISISKNGMWAGDGWLDDDNQIRDCPAVLGATPDDSDETYTMIEDAITAEPQDEGRYTGSGEIERPDGVYAWQIEMRTGSPSGEEDECHGTAG